MKMLRNMLSSNGRVVFQGLKCYHVRRSSRRFVPPLLYALTDNESTINCIFQRHTVQGRNKRINIMKEGKLNYQGMSLLLQTYNLEEIVKETNLKFNINQSYETLILKYGSTATDKLLTLEKKYKKNFSINLDFVFEYQKVGQVWQCKHRLKEPSKITFHDISFSKRAAGFRTTLAALVWFEHMNGIVLNRSIQSHGNELRFEKMCNTIQPRSHLDTTYLKSFLNEIVKENDEAIRLRPFTINQNYFKNYVSSVVKSNHCINSRKFSTSTSSSVDSSVNSNVSKNKSISTSKSVPEAITDVSHTRQIKVAKNDSDPNLTNRETSLELDDPLHHESFSRITKLFPSPKNVLHNIFDTLCIELKNKDLRLSPSYKAVSIKGVTQWNCTYKLTWPQDLKFTLTAATKQEASKRAATAVLTYLLNNKKITPNGQPIIYDNNQMKELTRKSISKLSLNSVTVNKLVEINDLYKNEIQVLMKKNELAARDLKNADVDTCRSSITELGEVQLDQRRQRYLGINHYLAKEKVNLPISEYKEIFTNLIKEKNIVIIKGEPGCGKSTRIPQYVLEAWASEDGLLGVPCRIVVTQPRRIAAISLAERVAAERNENVGDIIGYQVRLKSLFRPHSGKILYCTTGILLRQLQSDSMLSKYSHIILDEAHERDVNTDLLMNLLKKAVNDNPKLKLIVMSATIDTDMFQEYFPNAAVMQVPGLAHPVKPFYLDQCKSLDLSRTLKMCNSSEPAVVHDDVVNVLRYIHTKKPEGAILCFLPGWEDISKIRREIPSSSEIMVLCLHSKLQDSEQYKIFSKPPPGVRKIILATNIAETSVTIDDVVYVVDTGIHKESRFDLERGVMCMDNHWISRASMYQRRGRAGRVRAGESFHLYPKTKADTFEEFSIPEILRTSLTKIVLDSKVYSANMNAQEFMNELPTPPEKNAVKRALDELKDLELITPTEDLTPLGRTLVDFQLEPKLAKAMVNAVIFKCVTPIVDIVTLFSGESNMFSSTLTDKESVNKIKKQFCEHSDHLSLMRIFEKYITLAENNDYYELQNFCSKSQLISHKLSFLKKLRTVHFGYLDNGLTDVLSISDDYSDNDELVKAVLLSGVGTILQHRNWDIVRGRYKNVNTFITRNNHRATITQESVLHKKTKFPSKYLLYINETRSNIRRTTVVRESSVISPIALLLFSNKELMIEEVSSKESISDSDDQICLTLKGTVKLLCNKEDAIKLIETKKALTEIYNYYINRLTQTNEYDPRMNHVWDKFVALLSDVLDSNKIL